MAKKMNAIEKATWNAAIEYADAIESETDDAIIKERWNMLAVLAGAWVESSKAATARLVKAVAPSPSEILAIIGSGIGVKRSTTNVLPAQLTDERVAEHWKVIETGWEQAGADALAKRKLAIDAVVSIAMAGISGNPMAFAPMAGSLAEFARGQLEVG